MLRYACDVVPEALDADSLRWIILVVLGVVVIAMYLVIRFVQKVTTRALMLISLAVVGVALFVERENLEDCVDTCSCTLFGEDVTIPETRNTGNCE